MKKEPKRKQRRKKERKKNYEARTRKGKENEADRYPFLSPVSQSAATVSLLDRPH